MMAAFVFTDPKDKVAFDAHWDKILHSSQNITRTIVAERATNKQSAVADPLLLGSGPVAHCLPATILRAGPGLSLVASTQHAIFTRPPCCPTAWSLLQGD